MRMLSLLATLLMTAAAVVAADPPVGSVSPFSQLIPVIHITDLYHPHEDPDDHFDLATMYALPGIELKAVILDKGTRQITAPGSVPVRQMNAITGRNVPYAIGLGRNLARLDDPVLDDKPEFQKGVELLLRTLRESPRPVSIVSLGSCRDLAAAFNREPELMRGKVAKLLIFIGEADPSKQHYREYNVALDPKAYARVMHSGLPVFWVPCFDGGEMRNEGRASFWRARHADVLQGCSPELLAYFIYALERKPAQAEDPIDWLKKPSNPAERDRLLAGTRNLWCAAVFVELAGKSIIRRDDHWQAVPSDTLSGAQPVFGFRDVEVSVQENGAIIYAAPPTGARVKQFVLLDRPNYAPAMTTVTADLLRGIK